MHGCSRESLARSLGICLLFALMQTVKFNWLIIVSLLRLIVLWVGNNANAL